MGGVPLPEGYHSVNPYIVHDAERLIDLLVEVSAPPSRGAACAPTATSTTPMPTSGTPW